MTRKIAESPLVIIHNQVSPHVSSTFKLIAKLLPLEVWYLTQHEPNRSWKEKPVGFRYSFLETNAATLSLKDSWTFFWSRNIWKKLQAAKPQAVIITGWSSPVYWQAFLFCKLHQIPILVWSGSTEFELSWGRTITKPLVMFLVRACDGCIAYGTRARSYLVKLGAKKEKITIAFNATDVSYPSKLRVKLTPKLQFHKKSVILFYGQLLERKGVRLLISAFNEIKTQYPNSLLLLVGSGPLEAEVAAEAQKHASQCIWLPNPGDVNMPEYLSQATCLVLPSSEEVWGLVVNQAMAHGLPCIVSNRVGAAPDLVISGKTGYVFPAGSRTGLIHALHQILRNPAKAKLLGYQAKQQVATITPELTAKAIVHAVQKIV